MLHAHLVALVLAATALVASGCGGSSKTTASTGTTGTTQTTPTTATSTGAVIDNGPEIKIQSGKPLTRSVFIARADAICATGNAKHETLTARTVAEFARLLPQAAAYDHTEAMELSKLVPPADMAVAWKNFVNGVQKFGEVTAKAAEDAQQKKIQAADSIVIAGNKLQREFIATAKHNGFKQCSHA